jgi:hypothetical protein
VDAVEPFAARSGDFEPLQSIRTGNSKEVCSANKAPATMR